MMARIIRLILIISFFLHFVSCSSTQVEKKIFSFTQEISADASPAVLKAVMQLDNNSSTILSFEKGTYHFYPDKAYEMFCHISNHEDVLTRTPFPLLNKKNITINGNGAKFIFHGKMIPFVIEHSENIELKNLSVDWEQAFHSELKVVAHHPNEKTFDFEISEAFPYEIRNGQIWFIREGYQHDLGQSIFFDPVRKTVAFNSRKVGMNNSHKLPTIDNVASDTKYGMDFLSPNVPKYGIEYRLEFEEIKPGLVRVHNYSGTFPPIGWVLVAKGEKGLNRIAPAIRVTDVKEFNINNVTVHHASGMGLIAENSENLYLDGFKVIPSGKRILSTTADATHFVGCRGKVELRNCTMHNQMDDALNVHGTYQQVVDVLGENKLGVRVGHFEQQNFLIGRENDTIGLVRLKESFDAFHKLTLKGIKIINGRYQIITFNEKLPSNIQQGDLIENLCAYPEVLVENCHIRGNRARGLLLSTPKKIVVRNNYFQTQMDAILMPVESSSWFESGSVKDLTITNNIFEDCNHGGIDRGVIRFVTDDDNENIAFRNITIENNTFKHFDNLIMEVSNTDNLAFKNNIIEASPTFPALFPNNPAIKIKASEHLSFEHNTFKGKAKVIFESDQPMAEVQFK